MTFMVVNYTFTFILIDFLFKLSDFSISNNCLCLLKVFRRYQTLIDLHSILLKQHSKCVVRENCKIKNLIGIMYIAFLSSRLLKIEEKISPNKLECNTN